MSSYLKSRGARGSIDKIQGELDNALVFESRLGCYILEEIYPDKADNKTLHGLKFATDLNIKDQKYILNRYRRKNIGSIDDFCRYRLIRYPSIEFVEENNAKAIMERITDKVTQGKALLNIWTEYSQKELEKAEQLSGLFGIIFYSDGQDMTNHVKLLKLNLTKEQATALKEHENDFKNSSFDIPNLSHIPSKYLSIKPLSKISFPAGTGVCVVNTVFAVANSFAISNDISFSCIMFLISSNVKNAECPSFI
jgi:hypothetical protein